MPILTVFKFVIAVALILFGCLLWDLNFFLGFVAGSIFGIVGGWLAVPGVIALIVLIWIVSSSADEKDTDIGLLGLLIGSIAGALISWLVIPLTIVVIFVLWILGFAGEVETIPQPTESKAHELSSDLDRKIDATLKSTTKPSVSQPSSQQLSAQPLPISKPVSEQPAPQPMIQSKKSTSPKKKVDKRRKIEEERARKLKKILNELKDVFQNPYVRKEIWDDIENKRLDDAENKINEIFECLDKYRELEVRIRKLKNKIAEFKKTVLAFPIRDNVVNDLLERLDLAKEELDWDELEEIEKCIEKEEKKLRKFEEKLKEKKKKISKIKREIKRLKEKEKNLNVEYIQGLVDEVEKIITKDPNNKLVNLLLYKAELAIEKANQFLDKVSELRNHMEEFKKTYPDIDLGNLYKSLEIAIAEGIVLDKLKAIDESMNQLREFLDDFNKVRYKVENKVEEDTKTVLISLCDHIYEPFRSRWNEDVLVGSTSKIKR
ncbi:MAG TPA: hypothetical protein ENI51_01870, partial [Candidatus Atribacteria bacterium]|nr:hypothetical protein [Candidatus Atribacteria bacterium]